MQAIWNGTVVAEAPQEDLIRIEGNWYFPPDAIKKEYFTPTDLHTTCIWKGDASYYDVTADGETFENGAWYYPEPKDGSVDRVKKDFKDYVAFYPQIQVA